MHIYIVNGAPGSGKTTFEEFAMELLGEDVRILSTVDDIKQAARYLGWDGVKTPKSRKFLSDLKDLWTEFDDGPVKSIKRRVSNIERSYTVYDIPADDAVIFIDSREPEEIDRLKRELGAKTILIKRASGADDAEILNHADRDVENYQYDYIIPNDYDLDELKVRCIEFLLKENIKIPSR